MRYAFRCAQSLGMLLYCSVVSANIDRPFWQDGTSQYGPGRNNSVDFRKTEKRFIPDRATCAANDICSLREVLFRTNHRIIFPDPKIPDDTLTIVTTRMLFGYKTDTVDELSGYGIVQLTRGCMWYSQENTDKTVSTEFGIVRDHLGLIWTQHLFPDWTIDSTTTDPLYTSESAFPDRHYFLRFFKTPPVWIPDFNAGTIWGEQRPASPRGYIVDQVGPVAYNSALRQASNASLEYRTCLLRMSDVPGNWNGNSDFLEKAIVCFDWETKFVFDHKRGQYEIYEGKPIDNECGRPLTARERFYRENVKRMPS